MFEAESRDVILERLKKYYDEVKQTDVSAVEGTFSFDTLAANAKEFEKAYAEMDLIVEAAFPQTSWGKYLDYLAEELAGLTRRAATKASVELTITGTAGAYSLHPAVRISKRTHLLRLVMAVRLQSRLRL